MPAGLPPVRPYRDYLAWLADQDGAAALAAWRAHLAGLDGPTPLAGAARATAAATPGRWELAGGGHDGPTAGAGTAAAG